MELTPDNLYSDTVDPVRRMTPDELFLVRIEAIPEPDNPEAADTGGAFVNCWLDVDDLRSAELEAIEIIRYNGWRPQRLDTWELVSRSSCGDSAEQVEEAFHNGSACAFFAWPLEAPDSGGIED